MPAIPPSVVMIVSTRAQDKPLRVVNVLGVGEHGDVFQRSTSRLYRPGQIEADLLFTVLSLAWRSFFFFNIGDVRRLHLEASVHLGLELVSAAKQLRDLSLLCSLAVLVLQSC